MVWPVRPGTWPNAGREAGRAFARIAMLIAKSERVWFLASPEDAKSARAVIEEVRAKVCEERSWQAEELHPVTVLEIPTDDSWARDIGPTVVVNDKGDRIGIDWCFNAWGGTYDGLYPDWRADDAAASAFCEAIGLPRYDMHPFVLEGGAIHADGEGTILVTEACLLSKGRNPELGREEIERVLCDALGGGKVLWLPHGIYEDETDEHVDNICAFIRPGEVVLATCEDPADPQYAMSQADLAYLRNETDARGRKLIVHELPVPKRPVLADPAKVADMQFFDDERGRSEGERLAASYVNFYIANGGIVMPVFGDVNDERAVRTLQALFPDRAVYPLDAEDIIIGGGNIHCITQQIPRSGQ